MEKKFRYEEKNKDERKVAMMKKNIPSSKVRKDCVNEYFFLIHILARRFSLIFHSIHL